VNYGLQVIRRLLRFILFPSDVVIRADIEMRRPVGFADLFIVHVDDRLAEASGKTGLLIGTVVVMR
jgi:hypothetical protein